MSAGLLQRLEAILEPVWHHHNPFYRKDVLMTALSRLAAAVGDLTAENANLKKQIADAQSKPAGASDQDLNGITSQIEAALGHSVADPDASGSTGSQGGATAEPVVGNGSTTVSDPATGNTTTLDHASGTATTTDASGATVTTDQTAADAAKAAASAAGVAVPTT